MPWVAKTSYGGPSMAEMVEKGYLPVGRGKAPADRRIVYAPTGAISKGFRGRREKLWIGRWFLPEKEDWAIILLRHPSWLILESLKYWKELYGQEDRN